MGYYRYFLEWKNIVKMQKMRVTSLSFSLHTYRTGMVYCAMNRLWQARLAPVHWTHGNEFDWFDDPSSRRFSGSIGNRAWYERTWTVLIACEWSQLCFRMKPALLPNEAAFIVQALWTASEWSGSMINDDGFFEKSHPDIINRMIHGLCRSPYYSWILIGQNDERREK